MSTIADTRELSLAARIKIARIGADLDQEQVARALGTSRGAVSHWEQGRHQIKLVDAVKLAAITGVTLEWLAAGIDENTPAENDEGGTVRPKGFEPLAFWSVVHGAFGGGAELVKWERATHLDTLLAR